MAEQVPASAELAGLPPLAGISTENLFSAEYFHAIRIIILHVKPILRVTAAGAGLAAAARATFHREEILTRWA
jgi:hypothetical protein